MKIYSSILLIAFSIALPLQASAQTSSLASTLKNFVAVASSQSPCTGGGSSAAIAQGIATASSSAVSATTGTTNSAGSICTPSSSSNADLSQDAINAANRNDPVNTASPLIFDLENDGVKMLTLADTPVYFDINADGKTEQVAWVNPTDGFLVYDRNHDSIINNRKEMFGNMRGALNGFEDLALLDSNQDALINSEDPIFKELRVWVDSNSDAKTDAGELHTLDELQIASINLKAQLVSEIIDGQWLSHTSTFTKKDGSTSKIHDIWLQAVPKKEASSEQNMSYKTAALDNKKTCYNGADPLVLDFNGDGVHFTDVADKDIYFDIFDKGEKVKTSWYAPGEHILVIDHSNNGEIDGLGEIVGGIFINGFEYLEINIDENQDGVINAADPKFNTILVWEDKNGNAVSEEGELKPLSAYNVVEINLKDRKRMDWSNNKQLVAYRSEFTLANGHKSYAYASYVRTATDPTYTDPDSWVFPENVTLKQAVAEMEEKYKNEKYVERLKSWECDLPYPINPGPEMPCIKPGNVIPMCITDSQGNLIPEEHRKQALDDTAKYVKEEMARLNLSCEALGLPQQSR